MYTYIAMLIPNLFPQAALISLTSSTKFAVSSGRPPLDADVGNSPNHKQVNIARASTCESISPSMSAPPDLTAHTIQIHPLKSPNHHKLLQGPNECFSPAPATRQITPSRQRLGSRIREPTATNANPRLQRR